MNRIILFLLLLVTFQSYSQSRIVLDNNVRMVISNNAFIVVDNPNPNAVADNSSNCGIISEGENNKIRWNVGTGSGSFSIPFYDEDNATRIPLTFNVTSPGTGSGFIDFSTYDGTTWDNNTYRPSMVTHTQLYYPPNTANNSDKMTDRFWLLNAQNFTAKPSGSIVFTYIDAEYSAAGNNISEPLLSAKRFNNGSAVWSDMLNSGTANTGANSVTTSNISSADLFAAWTLVDPTCNIGGTTAGSNGPLCEGNTLNLSASGGTSYTWSGPASFSSSQQNPVINPADPSASGTYTVIITNDYNCKDTIDVTVVVNSVTADAGTDQSIVNGSSTTLGATASGGSGNYSYSWSPSAALVNAGVQNPQTTNLTSTTTYTVTITDITTGCTSTDDIVVTVTGSVLSANATSNPSTICLGGSVQLNANAGGGSGTYTYTWASVPAGFSSSAANPTDNPSQDITYYVTINDGIGTATSSVSIVVNSVPTALATSNSPVCENKNIELLGSGGATYEWSGPGGFTSTDQNPVVSSAILANAGTYTVTVTNDLGCTSTDTAVVIVNSEPSFTVSSNSPVCEGSDLNLYVTAGYSWTWTGPNSFTSTDQNPVITPSVVANAGNYTVVVVSAEGCSATGYTDVVINASPTATATSNSPVCENENINLQSGTANSYSWTGPDGFISVDQNPVVTSAQVINAGTYSVTVTNSDGCTASANTDVTVNTGPSITVSSNSPVCSGGTINLSVTGGISWSWSGPDSFTSTDQNPSITSATSLNAGTYSVVATSAEGCTATGTTDVTMGGSLAVTPTSNSPLCEGEDLMLTVSGGTTYSWSGPDSWTATTASPSITSVTTDNAGTYYVTVSDVTGCTGTGTVTVVVNPAPLGVADNNGPVCEGGSLMFTSSGGSAYVWSGPDSFTSTISNPSISNVTLLNGGVYTVTVTQNNCSVTVTTTAVVNAAPVVNASSNSPVCEGSDINLSSMGGGTYSWTGPGGFISTEQNPSIDTALLTDGGTYTVLVTSANGCSDTQDVIVTVDALPVVTCANNDPDCPGDPIMLQSSGGTSYLWSGPGGFTSTDQNPVILLPSTLNTGIYFVTVSSTAGCSATGQTAVNYPLPIIISGVVSQSPTDHLGDIDITVSGGQLPYTYLWSNGMTTEDVSGLFSATYFVSVTDAGLCEISDTFIVDIPLIIPNVITPNGDGANDDFEIINIGAYEKIRLEIYNRWGDLLFLFDGTGPEYTSPENRWNGQSNGKDLPMGSYLYILNLDGMDPLTGAVLLKY